MLQLSGVYFEGKVHQEKIIPTDKPLKVDVLFEEDIEPETKNQSALNFSFQVRYFLQTSPQLLAFINRYYFFQVKLSLQKCSG